MMNISKYALVFLSAAVLCLILTPLGKRLARTFGALDLPEARRVHSRPTPRWGGLGVYASILIALTAAGRLQPLIGREFVAAGLPFLAVVVGATALMLLGLIDDLMSVRPAIKLSLQIICAGLVSVAGGGIRSAFGIELGHLAIPAAILWIVALTNAFNMVDGLDGLAPGLAVMMSTTLMLLSVRSGNVASAMLLAALCGSLVGFLRYNFNPASIFLGDSGSLPIGFVMAAVSLEASNKGPAAVTLLVPILALGLPLAELSLTTGRRILRAINVVRSVEEKKSYDFHFSRRVSLFTADREHIHHRLLGLGLSQVQAVLVLYAICFAVNAGAMLVVLQNTSNRNLLIAVSVVCSIAFVRTLNYKEFHPLHNGLLLPLFPVNLLKQRSFQVLLDSGLAAISLLFSIWIHNPGGLQLEPAHLFIRDALLLVAVQVACLGLGGLYQKSYPFAGAEDLLVLARAVTCAVLGTWVVSYLLDPWGPRGFEAVILDLYGLATLVICSRISFHLMDHAFKMGRKGSRRIMIYGIGNSGLAALHEIQGNPALDMSVVGFIDDSTLGKMFHGLPVIRSDRVDLSSRNFDEIVLATPKEPEKAFRALSARCRLAQIPIKQVSINWTEVDSGSYESSTGELSNTDSQRKVL
jgi:UDP-GlcNAc:undecaprenyl-phosphate GlcNAc-1-phosphate transferase